MLTKQEKTSNAQRPSPIPNTEAYLLRPMRLRTATKRGLERNESHLGSTFRRGSRTSRSSRARYRPKQCLPEGCNVDWIGSSIRPTRREPLHYRRQGPPHSRSTQSLPSFRARILLLSRTPQSPPDIFAAGYKLFPK